MSYSERLLHQGSNLTRLAHQSRFDRVLDLLHGQSYSQVLDYGCGDGWLLRAAYERGLITAGVGVDVEPAMLTASQDLFQDLPEFRFCQPTEMPQALAPQSCDLLLCTETLEHVGDATAALDQMLSYCKPKAQVIISVPIEVGPALLFKQGGRYLANLKGNYGYEPYTLKELLSASLWWDTDSFPSSHQGDRPMRSHKGFDYRKVRQLLQERMTIEQQMFSPLPLFGPLLNSTVIWSGQKS